MRRILPLAITGLALIAAPANAATIGIELDDTRAVTPQGVTGAGVKLYQASFASAVVVRGAVVDDNSLAPPAGTIVHLATITHAGEAPKPLADVVTLADGSFSRTFVPSHSFTIVADVARPSDPIITGLSAADAIPVVLGIGPNIELTTKLVQRGQPYRIKGLIDIPGARNAGTILLKRRSPGSKKYVAVAVLRTRTNGTFAFAVVHRKTGTYRYQIIFRPKDKAVWITQTLKLSVTFSRN